MVKSTRGAGSSGTSPRKTTDSLSWGKDGRLRRRLGRPCVVLDRVDEGRTRFEGGIFFDRLVVSNERVAWMISFLKQHETFLFH